MLDILQFCASILNACLHAPFGRKRSHLISVSPASSVTPPASPIAVATALPTSITTSTLVSATALTILTIVARTEVVAILVAALISKLIAAPIPILASVMVAKLGATLVALLRTVRWHVHVGRRTLPHAVEIGWRGRGNEATTSLELRWWRGRNTEWRHWHRELALKLA